MASLSRAAVQSHRRRCSRRPGSVPFVGGGDPPSFSHARQARHCPYRLPEETGGWSSGQPWLGWSGQPVPLPAGTVGTGVGVSFGVAHPLQTQGAEGHDEEPRATLVPVAAAPRRGCGRRVETYTRRLIHVRRSPQASRPTIARGHVGEQDDGSAGATADRSGAARDALDAAKVGVGSPVYASERRTGRGLSRPPPAPTRLSHQAFSGHAWWISPVFRDVPRLQLRPRAASPTSARGPDQTADARLAGPLLGAAWLVAPSRA
jgi:hypothetical protein